VKTYLYNAAGQLTNWAVTANSWSRNRNLGYDVAGRIVTQKVNSAVRTNMYDLTDQLLTSSGSYAYSGTYDAVGNRLTADGWTSSNNVVNGYTWRASGSLTNAISYDANGNVSGISDWVDGMFGLSLTHDSQGQLVGLDNSFCTGTLSYDYRRLRVESDDDCSGDTLYTYDARGNLLDQSNTSYRVQYAYADGIDSAVLMRAGGNLYALVADHLGSIVAMFDHTGHVESSGDYAPFGNTGAPPVDSTLAFTGRESYFGLYYLRNRWYSPDLGRFQEPDPIGLAGGDVNIYRYVGNSPLNWVDPDGLSFWSSFATGFVHGVITAAAVGAVAGLVVGLGASLAVVTGTLMVAGAIGLVATGVSLYYHHSADDTGYALGAFTGATLMGASMARSLATVLSPPDSAPAPGLAAWTSHPWTDGREGPPSTLAFLRDWLFESGPGPMSTGPDVRSAMFSTGFLASDFDVLALGPCP
jgi:RHS repeat-associated protein